MAAKATCEECQIIDKPFKTLPDAAVWAADHEAWHKDEKRLIVQWLGQAPRLITSEQKAAIQAYLDGEHDIIQVIPEDKRKRSKAAKQEVEQPALV